MTRAETILKSSGMSLTNGRKSILDVFLSSKTALTHQDIESKCSNQFDRVTIYRTLQTFIDKGLIHTIPSTDSNIRYALCNEACFGSGHHHDNHVHFKCERCGDTICLDEVTVPVVKLPSGYSLREINMVVSGTCRSCKK